MHTLREEFERRSDVLGVRNREPGKGTLMESSEKFWSDDDKNIHDRAYHSASRTRYKDIVII